MVPAGRRAVKNQFLTDRNDGGVVLAAVDDRAGGEVQCNEAWSSDGEGGYGSTVTTKERGKKQADKSAEGEVPLSDGRACLVGGNVASCQVQGPG